MNTWTLVIILTASPLYQNGGYASSVVVPGFTTEQACINASRAIKVPGVSTQRVVASNTFTCVANGI